MTVDPAAVYLGLGLLAIGWCGCFIFAGLFLGERRSSQTLRNVAQYGRPDRPQARDLTPEDPEQKAKERAEKIHITRQVDRLSSELKQRARNRGENVTDEEAREHARDLLRKGYEKAAGGMG